MTVNYDFFFITDYLNVYLGTNHPATTNLLYASGVTNGIASVPDSVRAQYPIQSFDWL